MVHTRVRVQIAMIFGAAAVLLAYMAGRIDVAKGGFTVGWSSIAVCLFLIIIAPIIADSNIKHRKEQEPDDAGGLE